jgi:hypothetical protein
MFKLFSPNLDHLQGQIFHNFTMARPKALAVSNKSAPSKVGIAKATLLTLPAELKLMIFSYLSPTASVCLGLSCKLLYTLHRLIYGKYRCICGAAGRLT